MTPPAECTATDTAGWEQQLGGGISSAPRTSALASRNCSDMVVQTIRQEGMKAVPRKRSVLVRAFSQGSGSLPRAPHKGAPCYRLRECTFFSAYCPLRRSTAYTQAATTTTTSPASLHEERRLRKPEAGAASRGASPL